MNLEQLLIKSIEKAKLDLENSKLEILNLELNRVEFDAGFKEWIE